jgi:hypothetical protein
MSLQPITAPPAPAPVEAAPVSASTTPEVTTPVQSTETPVTTTPTPATPTPKSRTRQVKSAVESIGERIEQAKADEAAAKAAGKTIEQYRADKAAAEQAKAEPETKPAAEKPKTGDDLSDEAFKAQVESETKGMDPSKSKSWAELRYEQRALKRAQKDMVPKAEVAKYEAQLNELKQQIEAAKANTPADPTEVTELKAKLAEYEADLMVAKVERTDAYKNGVTAVRENVQKTVDKLAAKYEVKPSELMAALHATASEESDAALVEIVEKMNRFDAGKVDNLLQEIAKANSTETVLRANAKEALAKIEAKQNGQTQEQVAAAKAAREAAHKKNWQAVAEGELKSVLAPVENAPEWTQAQQQAQEFASTVDFNALSPEDSAVAAQRLAVYPLVMGTLQLREQQLSETNTKLEEALQRLAKFEENKARGGSLVEGGPSTDPAKGKTDFVERINARIAEATAAGVRLKPV